MKNWKRLNMKINDLRKKIIQVLVKQQKKNEKKFVIFAAIEN